MSNVDMKYHSIFVRLWIYQFLVPLTRKQIPLTMEASFARIQSVDPQMYQGRNVSFRQLRTCLPDWLRPPCADISQKCQIVRR